MDFYNDEFDFIDDEVTNFDYDATASSKNRKQPKRYTTSEDYQLKDHKRGSMISDIRNLRQNFGVARWAIQKHLDFITPHEFMPKTGNESTDMMLREFVDFASLAENFDISGRHDRRRWMRIAEASRIVDGDVFALRVRGGYLQAIEADRIQNPDKITMEKLSPGTGLGDSPWVNGVRINDQNRPLSYSIWSRSNTSPSMEWERNIKASAMMTHGFYDRFDQIRGISPWAAAANSLRDLYEAWDYALAKTKVAQLMALKITREAQDGISEEYQDLEDVNAGYGGSDGETSLSFDKGPLVLDMDPGEDANIITGHTPGEETTAYWREMISVVLKSLNIPYSFYDESNVNYSSSRSALILYLRSAQAWRQDVQRFMDEWLQWRLKVGMVKGEIQLPSDFDIAKKPWSWIPEGTNYWSPREETQADIEAVAAGLRTRTEIRQERFGDDWKTNVYDVLKVENELLADVLPELKQQKLDNDMAQAAQQQAKADADYNKEQENEGETRNEQ